MNIKELRDQISELVIKFAEENECSNMQVVTNLGWSFNTGVRTRSIVIEVEIK